MKELRQAVLEFGGMKMELGEHPRKFVMRVDTKLRRLGMNIEDTFASVVILNGVGKEYDTEVRMLENCGEPCPPRGRTLDSLINQYNRLPNERSEAGGKALAAAGMAGSAAVRTCQLCHKLGHSAEHCRAFQITAAQGKREGGGKVGCGAAAGSKKDHKGDKECWVCGKSGHLSFQCDQKKGEGSSRDGRRKKKGAFLAKTVDSTSTTGDKNRRLRYFEQWFADSGATEHMTPDSTGQQNYRDAETGTTVEVATNAHVPVAGYGSLELEFQQEDGLIVLVLKEVAHVPALGRNLFSTKKAARVSGLDFGHNSTHAWMGSKEEPDVTFYATSSTELFEAKARRVKVEMERACA